MFRPTYSNLHSAVTVRTTLAKLRSHIHRLYGAVLYNTIENLVTYSTQFAKTPASPAHHGIRNTVTHTSGRSHLPRLSICPLFTLHTLPTITHKHLTPYIFSYPTEWTRSSTPRSTHTTTNRSRPSSSSRKQPTSLHRQLTILLLNCKKTN
jgi:hypothetical protein